MIGRESGAILDGIRTLFGVGTASSMTDGQLLDRFLGGDGDAAESAFAALVERHGPMVLRVCRGVLGDLHQADDAFQASFLILARKAGSVRKSGSLASWLFGVARRVAVRAKADRARRVSHERRRAAMADDPARTVGSSDPMPEVHEEVGRLPAKYRVPILLCYFEGLTHEEAAGQLGLPVGTVKVRLSRARERLRGRLARRGLAPTLAIGVAAGDASGAVPARLAESTIRAAARVAAGWAAGVSAPVAALVEGVLGAMSLIKLKPLVALAVVGLTLLVASTSASPRRPDAPSQETAGPNVAILKTGEFHLNTNLIGTVEAAESSNLTPRFSGTIKSMKVDIGDTVKRGQVVAEIDAPELGLDLEKAKAVVDQSRARRLTAEAAVAVAQASLEARKALTATADAALHRAELDQAYHEKVYKRLQELGEGKAIEPRLVDEGAVKVEAAKSAVAEAKAQAIVIRAGIDEAMARLESAKSGIREAQADLQVAQIDVTKAAMQQDSATIRSPIDGVVTRRSLAPGDFVRAGGEPNSAPMLTIVRANKVRVVVHVPDRDVPLLDKGDRVAVRIDAMPGRLFEGAVSRTAYAEDPARRSLRTEIDLENADGLLRPGQSGQVVITLEHRPNCLMLSERAIISEQAEPHDSHCFRMVDGKPVRTLIKLGRSNGTVSIIDEGLKAGDAVWVGAFTATGEPATNPEPVPSIKKN
jgi:HlyD family secretion protein